MNVTVVRIEGTPAEFQQVDIKSLLSDAGTPAAGNGGLAPAAPTTDVVPADIREFVNAKASRHGADLFLRFLGEVIGKGAVLPKLGGTHRADGGAEYIRLNGIPQRKGAFVYVNPRNGNLDFRLRVSDTPDMKLAVTRNNAEYQVRLHLSSEAALADALVLAQLARDRANVRGDGRTSA
jgi:hypothetical protein